MGDVIEFDTETQLKRIERLNPPDEWADTLIRGLRRMDTLYPRLSELILLQTEAWLAALPI
jgi:hypothetical protein